MSTKFLSVSQVAEKLHVSTKTIRQYIKAGKLKASKLNGKNFVISEVELVNFIERSEYKPFATI